MSHDLTHEPDANRYVLRVNGTLAATVDYRVAGNLISLTRTFTTPALRGKGLAGIVTEFAVDDIDANTTLRIVPMCWYVGEWFDKHPERAALLTR